jgi:hypothetical protein
MTVVRRRFRAGFLGSRGSDGLDAATGRRLAAPDCAWQRYANCASRARKKYLHVWETLLHDVVPMRRRPGLQLGPLRAELMGRVEDCVEHGHLTMANLLAQTDEPVLWQVMVLLKFVQTGA